MKHIIGINFRITVQRLPVSIASNDDMPKLLTMLKQLKINATLLKRITPPTTW